MSAGELLGDEVQCGYHGLRFDSCGTCVSVPGQDRIPSRTNVVSRPLVRHPNFWLWLAMLWTLNGLHALVLTMANSLAMQPLVAFAGTGSGLIGTMSMMGGAVMASFVAATIDGSATPMAAAYCGFGLLAGLSLWWARGDNDSPLGAS